VASYPRCSIASEQEPMQSCLPSQDSVSTIDSLVYPMGAWEPLLPLLGPSDLESPFESDLVVGRSSSPHACDYLLIDSTNIGQSLHPHMEYVRCTSPFKTIDPRLRDFSDFADEAILEAMTTNSISWEDLHVFFPFGRLSKLTIKETLGLSLTVGST
jgi:hypothetical protein